MFKTTLEKTRMKTYASIASSTFQPCCFSVYEGMQSAILSDHSPRPSHPKERLKAANYSSSPQQCKEDLAYLSRDRLLSLCKADKLAYGSSLGRGDRWHGNRTRPPWIKDESLDIKLTYPKEYAV